MGKRPRPFARAGVPTGLQAQHDGGVDGVVAVYAAVIWMIVDILRRADFSGLEKVLWSIAGLVFSVATLIVYFVWVRKRTTRASRAR